MSRLEKTIQKKIKRRKLSFVSKVLFILFMSINLMVCIFIINKNTKMMLGEENYSIDSIIIGIQTFINEKVSDMNIIKKELLSQLNK